MTAWSSSSSSLSEGASEQTPLCSARPKKHRYLDGRSVGRLREFAGAEEEEEDHRDNECRRRSRSSVFFSSFVAVVNSLEEVKFGRFRQQPLLSSFPRHLLITPRPWFICRRRRRRRHRNHRRPGDFGSNPSTLGHQPDRRCRRETAVQIADVKSGRGSDSD